MIRINKILILIQNMEDQLQLPTCQLVNNIIMQKV